MKIKDYKLNKIALIVLILWFIAQITVIIFYWGSPQYGDAHTYQALAYDCFIHKSWYPAAGHIIHSIYIFNPGYVNFLIIQYYIFGTLLFCPIINLMMNVILLFSLYRISCHICNKETGLLFIILFCIIHSNTIIVATTFTELFFCTLLYGSIAFVQKNCWKLAISGILMITANFVRPLGLIFLIPIILFMLYKKYNYKHLLTYMFSLVISSSLLSLWNYNRTGYSFMQTSTGGANLIIGNNDNMNGSFKDNIFEKGGCGYIADFDKCDVFKKDSIWKSRAIKWIIKNKTKFIKYIPVKIGRLWVGDCYYEQALTDFVPFDMNKETSNKNSHITNIIICSIGYYLCWILALIGLWNIRKKLLGFWGIFTLPLLLGTLMHGIMYGGMRYHYPYMPILILYAAICLYLLLYKNEKGLDSFTTN